MRQGSKTNLNLAIGFQFTHPRGVRQVTARGTRVNEQGFNSRTHEGCDLLVGDERLSDYKFQFTHPRGVRQGSKTNLNLAIGFQFTHPRGVRPTCDLSCASLQEFQFTHPRGVRQSDNILSKWSLLFQFTHPRGVRHDNLNMQQPTLVSIHAPTRGATEYVYSKDLDGKFQFTHPRGVRLLRTPHLFSASPFQFTHPRGVRPFPQIG